MAHKSVSLPEFCTRCLFFPSTPAAARTTILAGGQLISTEILLDKMAQRCYFIFSFFCCVGRVSMRTIDWWVRSNIFPHIRDHTKRLEVWPKNRRLESVHVGDILWINRQLYRQVLAIRFYNSFATAVEREDFCKIWPLARSREELCQLWRSIYPKRAEKKGVLVFELGKID